MVDRGFGDGARWHVGQYSACSTHLLGGNMTAAFAGGGKGCWLLVIVAAGCSGGATGHQGLEGPEPPARDGACAQIAEHMVEADDPTALGFAAKDVLSSVLGSHRVPLRWLALRGATYEASMSNTQIDVTLTRAEGPISEARFHASAGSGVRAAACEGRLAVPVDAHVRTDDGALDERFRSTLVILPSRAASLQQSLDPAGLSGSLHLSNLIDAERKIVSLSLSATIDRYGLHGSLLPQFVYGTAWLNANQNEETSDETLASWGCLSAPSSAEASSCSERGRPSF